MFRYTGKIDAVHALMSGEGYRPQKKIAEILRIHRETIKRISRDEVNMRKASFKWVLPAPNSPQEAVWAQVLRELVDFPEIRRDGSLSNVHTRDET
jgi:hypothetical protein